MALPGTRRENASDDWAFFFQERVASLKTDFELAWLSWFVKKVAVTLKLHYLINSYCSLIKFALHLLPYVDDNFCKFEIDCFFSFYFMAKTEGPVFIETACRRNIFPSFSK